MNESISNHATSDYENEVEPCTFNNSNHVKRLLSSYVHPVICILAFVGNVLVILTIVLKKKRTKQENESDVFLLNLAISNLLFVVGLPFLIYNELFSWPMGQVACKLLQGSYSINLYSGMLLLAGISTVHYIIMGSSFENMMSRSLNVCRIMCAIIWVFAILVSVPTFYFHHWYEPSSNKKFMLESEEEDQPPPQYVCALRFNDSKSSRMVKLAVPSFQITFGFLLPLLIIIVCNTLIIISLLRKKASTEARFGRKGLEKKAIKKMIWIMVVFVVCHMPYNLILLYDTTNMFQLMPCEVADGWQTALSITQTIAYLQCCLNPVVYSLAGGVFRNNIKTFYLPSKKNQYICVNMTERPNQSCADEQEEDCTLDPGSIQEL